KAIAKVGTIAKCEIDTPAAARAWLLEQAANVHKVTLEPAAADLMIERLGMAMTRLDTELGKLAVSVEPGKPIGRELVEQSVGQTSDESAFVVQEAMLRALAMGPPRGPAAAIAKVRELIEVAGISEIV